jgi:ABC-type transport system involved in cytochrome bd biosynthesis fused ATPase/permease subunit
MMDSVSTSLNHMTTPDQRPVAIATQGLFFSYPDQPDVLRGIDLTVQDGERLGLQRRGRLPCLANR